MSALRSALTAIAIVVFAGLVGARGSRAEPPGPTSWRPISEVLAALQAAKADVTTIASVRWYAEVTHGESLKVPVGSPPTTLGEWGENSALSSAEAELGDCAPLEGAEAKAAAGLLKTHGAALPPGLRGFALAQSGQVTEAAAIYRSMALGALPEGACPSEHPVDSNRRVGRINRLLSCLVRWQPKGDHSAVKKVMERAASCAANNHAVG